MLAQTCRNLLSRLLNVVSRVLRFFWPLRIPRPENQFQREILTILCNAGALARQSGDTELRPDHLLAAMQARDALPPRQGRVLPVSPETTLAMQYMVRSAGSANKVTVPHLRAILGQGLPDSTRAVLRNARRFACQAGEKEITRTHLIAALQPGASLPVVRERVVPLSRSLLFALVDEIQSLGGQPALTLTRLYEVLRLR